jgi:tRNA/rRNA methyltransferase/tRNA (cytidine32/uridine32-2'-O)-methyltransferase
LISFATASAFSSRISIIATLAPALANPLASAEQMEGFYQHLQQTIADIGFLQPERSKSIMRRLRRIFNRTQLDTKELDILRGILRFSQNHNTKN